MPAPWSNSTTLQPKRLRARAVDSVFLRPLGSVREHGIRRTFQSVLSVCEDALFEMRYGLDTSAQVEQADLAVDSDNKQFAGRYQATRVRHFRVLMRQLSLPHQSAFVDFGSGMGRVLLLASQYDFKRIVGVEYSPELCTIARSNLAAFSAKTGLGGNIEIDQADAAEYKIEGDYNVFYINNSFDLPVFEKVLVNIRESLDQRSRRTWLICNYCNTVESTSEKETFGLLKEIRYGGTYFRVYSNS